MSLLQYIHQSLINHANEFVNFRMAYTLEKEPSNYMQTLTQYLSNIMNTVLLGLPAEMKELLYFLALSHAANKILVNLLSFERCYSLTAVAHSPSHYLLM